MRYLLDTNAVIALLNDSEGQISQRVRTLLPADFGLSSIVIHELYFGACKNQRRDRNLDLVDKLRFEVVPFDQEDSRHAGDVRCTLAVKDVPIGGYDVLIAGQARARGLTLLTRNVREFRRMTGLRIENWADS